MTNLARKICYNDGVTYIGDEMVPLHPPSVDENNEIKELYLKDKISSNVQDFEIENVYFLFWTKNNVYTKVH